MRGIIGWLAAILVLLSTSANAYTLYPGNKIDGTKFGYYVDHPERPVPDAYACNLYAEAHMAILKKLNIDAFYVVSMITYNTPPYYIYHIGVAWNENGQTYVWDNLAAYSASDLHNGSGYIWSAMEVNGAWYTVLVK